MNVYRSDLGIRLRTVKKKHYFRSVRTDGYFVNGVFYKNETPGRNDKCPCGSGKKYKNCCGKK